MKEHLYVKREYASMAENDQSAYVMKHGNFLILNGATFPLIPNNGVTMKAQGILLGDRYSMKDTSDAAMGLYKALQISIGEQMEENYNNVDDTANGNKLIIAEAGLNYSSENTTRVGVPSDFTNLKYTLSTTPNQVTVEWKSDQTAYGSLVITTTETDITLIQSGPNQLKLTIKGMDIFIDLTTRATVVVKNLIGGTDVKSRAVKFNTNGMNLLAVLQTIGVPKPLV